MTNQFLREVSCPKCLNPIDVRQHGRHVQCEACDSQFILEGHFCPRCFTYYDQPEAVCGQCSSPITRQCARCGAKNWAGDEYCVHCGTALDIFDVITRRHHEAFAAHRTDQRRAIKELKQKEALDSMKRWESLMADEQARLAQIRERQRRRQTQERQLILWVAALVVGIILVAGAVLLLTGGG